MHSKKTIICTLTLATALFAGCTEDLPERLTEPVPSVPVPTNLSAVLGDNQVTLSWSSDAGYSYSGFVIYRNETGETPARLATASTPPYVDNGVRTGAIYEYRVAGVSSGGIEGAPSTALLVRPTVFSAAINAGANYTNTRNVTLNLGAPVGTQLVRFSEDPGFAGAAWITFTTPIPFQLSAGDGLKTVYFEFTDEFGHPTESISDQITLDTETAIQSASFTPTTPATPGALLHFTVTPVGTELQGSAEILVPGLASSVIALDDGTGGDPTPNDGIYERNFVVPQSLRGTDLTVTAFFNDAAGNRSDAFELGSALSITDPPLNAVTLLPAQEVTVSSVSLRWSQATGANFGRYEIYRDTQPGIGTDDLRVSSITDVSVTAFVDTGLDEGASYYYRVFIANDLNETIGSNEISAQTIDDPPAAVVVDPPSSVTQTGLTLTWSESASTDFAEYRVYRSTQPGVTDVTGTEIAVITDRFTNFFDDTGINTTLNSYYYRVYVVDLSGNRTRSNEVSAIDAQTSIESASFSPAGPFAPGATVHFTVTPAGGELGGGAQITIATFGGSIIALDTGTGGDPTAGDGVYEADFVVPPSLRGTGLPVTVIFTDGAGNQSSAFEMVNVLSVTDPPAAVTLLAPVNTTTSSIVLTWSESSEPDFIRYEIYRDIAPGVSNLSSPRIANIADPSVTQFTDTGLGEGADYYYRIYVVNDLAEKTGSNELNVTTADDPPTAVILDPVSSLTQTSLTLTWSQNGNSDFLEYRVYRSTSPGVTNQPVYLIQTISNRFTTFFDDSGLDTGLNTYYYRVYVVDAALNATRSNEVQALDTRTSIQSASFTPTAPRQPGQSVTFSVTPTGLEKGGSAQITIEGFGGTITAFDNGTGGDQIAGNGIYQVAFTVPSSLRGTGLVVTAVFTDAAGNQSTPFEMADLLSITDPPSAVTLYAPTGITTTTLDLLWEPSTEPYFVRYEIYRGSTSAVSKTNSPRIASIADKATNFFTDTGLAQATTYYYRVYVINDLDESAGSGVVMAQTADIPPTPVVVDPVTSVTATGLTLNWSQNDDTDFQAYEIYRSTSPGVTNLSQQVAVFTDRYRTYFDDTGLNTVANTYYYRVYVIDQTGNNARSNEVSSAP